jgi:hypothetical protein
MDLKTLGKMTVIKLRDEALKIPSLEGVRGMTKEELIRAIAAARKLDLAGRKRGGAGKSDLKKQLRELRTTVAEAIKAKDSSRVKKLRRHVKRLKRQTRRLAQASALPEPAPETPAAVGSPP